MEKDPEQLSLDPGVKIHIFYAPLTGMTGVMED